MRRSMRLVNIVFYGLLIVVGGVIVAIAASAVTGMPERKFHRSVEIKATPERVWRLISDFDSYDTWNPFIISADGRPRRGTTLKLRIKPPGQHSSRLSAQIETARSEQELRWSAQTLVPGILDGDYELRIERLGHGKVRLVEDIDYAGLYTPLQGDLDAFDRGLARMNAALKRAAER